MTHPKRITLTSYDALHVYDWLLMYWRGEPKKFGGCYECERLGRRLERLLGPSDVRRIARAVKKNPGSPLVLDGMRKLAAAPTAKKNAKRAKG